MAKLTLTELREKHEFKLLALSVVTVLATGTIVYHFVEKWSWVDSTYFCVVTLATVGFGDLAPTHSSTKIFTIFYILSGVAVIMGFINFIVRRRERIRQERVEAKIK
jgi:hypothetical protein